MISLDDVEHILDKKLKIQSEELSGHIENEFNKLRERVVGLDQKIDSMHSSLDKKIDDVAAVIISAVDKHKVDREDFLQLEKRIEKLEESSASSKNN